MVLVPAGAFVTGTVHLKSHVTLSLDYGASFLGSQNWADYPTDKLLRAREGQSECLLYAEDTTALVKHPWDHCRAVETIVKAH